MGWWDWIGLGLGAIGLGLTLIGFGATLYQVRKTRKAVDSGISRLNAARSLQQISVLLRIERELDAALVTNSKPRTLAALADWRDWANELLAIVRTEHDGTPGDSADLVKALTDSTALASFAKAQVVGEVTPDLRLQTAALRDALGEVSRIAAAVATQRVNEAARGNK